MDTCRLWVTLGSGRRHRSEAKPTTFLRFARTGLLVGLPDEPGGQLVDGPLKQFPMRRVDADGLGLTAEDFAEGVAICREDSDARGLSWTCERVQLLIGAEDRIDALAPRAALVAEAVVAAGAVVTARAGSPAAIGAAAAPPVPAARPRRILAVVDPDAAEHPALEEAAALAREHRATVLLVATGELPETARHAADERAALTQRLEELAVPLNGLSVRTVVETSGDPVRGILAVADEAGVDLILAPATHSRFADAIEPRIAAALERRSPVPVRAVDRARPAGGEEPAAGARTVAVEAHVVIAGLPRDAGSRAWSEDAAVVVRRALDGTSLAGARLAIEAHWYATPASAVDHFALAPVLAALTSHAATETAAAARVQRLASEWHTTGNPANERLELHVRAA